MTAQYPKSTIYHLSDNGNRHPSLFGFPADVTLDESLDLVEVMGNYLHAKDQFTFDVPPNI